MNFTQFIFSLVRKRREKLLLGHRSLRTVACQTTPNFVLAIVATTTGQRHTMIDRPLPELIDAIAAVVTNTILRNERQRPCFGMRLRPLAFGNNHERMAAACIGDRERVRL